MALQPNDFKGAKGAFWAEKKQIDWENSSDIGASFGMIIKAFTSLFSKE